MVTSGAMRSFGETCSCAGRSNRCIGYHIVVESGNYFLSNLMVTSGAMRSFGETCSCAGRSNRCIGYHIVVESGNYFLSNLMVTSGAMRSFGETCSCASRSNRCIGYHIVVESGYKSFATYSTSLSSGTGCFGTGGVIGLTFEVTNVTICIATVIPNVFTSFTRDDELDGVDHCSFVGRGISFEVDCFGSRSVNLNFSIYTIIRGGVYGIRCAIYNN